MKLHKIYTKKPEDQWIIGTSMRLRDDYDPRDTKPHQFASMSESDFYNIIVPHRLLTVNYEGYVGYDRNYISDDILDVWYQFNLADESNAVSFANTFLDYVSDPNNPICSKAFEVYRKITTAPVYAIRYVVETANGDLFDLDGNYTTLS